MELAESETEMSRVIAKACWAAALKDSKTPLTKEQRVSHWQEHKKEYVKMGRVILRHLEKGGYKISAA